MNTAPALAFRPAHTATPDPTLAAVGEIEDLSPAEMADFDEWCRSRRDDAMEHQMAAAEAYGDDGLPY